MIRSGFLTCILVFGALHLPASPQQKEPEKELVQYVRDAKKAGLKDAQIQQNAIKAGWLEPAVKEAVDYVRKVPKTEPVASRSSTLVERPAGGAMTTEPAAPAKPEATPPKPEAAPAKTKDREQTQAAPAASVTVAPVTPQPVPQSAATPPATSAPALNPTAQPTTAGGNPPESAGGVVAPKVVSRGVPDDYRIGQGDVIAVQVWGEPAASVSGAMVRFDGKITMPLIKDIAVDGMTPAEAERVITEQLSKQIKAADVTVVINQVNSKKVYILGGGAKREGPLPYTQRMTIMQALSETGGLSDYAKRKKIYVLRNENGRQYRIPFDYDAVLRGERMELNIVLIPGDTIVVPTH